MKLRAVSKLLHSVNRRYITRRLQTTVASQNSYSNPADHFSAEQHHAANETAVQNRRHGRRDFGYRFRDQKFEAGDNSADRTFYDMDAEARRFGRVDPKSLESFLNTLKSDNREISSPVALKLLNFCGSNLPMYSAQKRIDMLNRVWDMLQERNFKFDVSHYNTLITLYLENDHDFLPINFLATLEKNAVEPNRVTFQRLIRRFAQMGDLSGVGTILEHMKSLEIPITEQVCNSLLFANIRAKNDQELQSVIQFMKDNELELTSESYYDMMCAYAENKDFDKIKKILEEHSEVVFTDAQMFNVMYTLLKNGVDHTKDLLPFVRKVAGFVHEALNASLKINVLGHTEAAVEILSVVQRPTTSAGEQVDFGRALLQQAVDLNFSQEKVLKLCKSMDENNINNHALENCYVAAAEMSNENITAYLMETMVDKYKSDNRAILKLTTEQWAELSKTPVGLRQQCFFPLILMYAQQNDLNGLKRVFDMMMSCNCTVENQTLAKWMWPNLPENIRNDISSIGTLHNKFVEIPINRIVSSFFFYKLDARDSAMVKEVLKSHPHQVTSFIGTYAIEYLISYAHATGDVETIAEFLSLRQANFRSSRDLDLVDSFVYDILRFPNEMVDSLLSEMVKKEVGTTRNVPEKVRPFVERKGFEYMDKLEKLAEFGQQIHLKVRAENAMNIDIPDDITTMDDQALSEYVKSSTYSMLNQHVQALIRNQKVDELCRLNATMDSMKKYSVPTLYISAMNLMVKANKLDEAVRFFNLTMKLKSPDFVMASNHLLNLFIYLAENQHFTDLLKCLELLNATTPTTTTTTTTTTVSQSPLNQETTGAAANISGSGGFQFSSQLKEHLLEGFIEKIFNSLPPNDDSSTTTTTDKINESLEERFAIFDALCKYKDFNVSYFHINFAMDRLISNDRTDVALRVFEIIYKNTNKLVKALRLLQALARKDNVVELQKVYDCMVAVMGDNRATVKLAICLAVVGRMKDAMRVLSAPNVRFSGEAMIREGNFCFEHREAQSLSCLLELTRGKNVYAREKLYIMLLNLYRQQKDYSSALNVWTTMQEENFITSKPILDLISEILKENGQKVPFETAEEKIETSTAPKFSASTSNLMSKLLANSGTSSSSSAPELNDNLKNVKVEAVAQ